MSALPHEPLDDLEELLVGVLAAVEDGEEVEAVLSRHPAHADGLRRRLAHLGELELAGSLDRPPPQAIGPYRLVSLLGSGGMGEVWRAVDGRGGGREVALKFVRVAALGASHAARFEREAQALRRLDHPGIVGIHDAGEVDGFRFIAMELLGGRSLDHALREEPRPRLRQVLRWGRDLARALSAAHAAGVVHRDVKPSNVQIVPGGGEEHDRAVLIDFGLTRGLGPSSVSITGRFVGSPHYAPPEQIRGDHGEVGPPADVYSLGVTLYEAVTGAVPFGGGSTEQLFHRILTHDPPPLRRHLAAVPADLETVLHHALEKRPEERYPSAAALAEDLEAVLELRPISVRGPGPVRRARGFVRRRPALAAALGVLVLALVGASVAWLVAQRADRLGRTEDARVALTEASALFDRYLEETRDLPSKLDSFAWNGPERATTAYDRDETAALDELQREIEASETLRAQMFASVMEKLRHAENLDPTLADVERLRARVYLDQWRLAMRAGETVLADFYAERVREHDATGDLADQVVPRRLLDVTTTPPGARVDAFCFARDDSLPSAAPGDAPGGDPRLVPVPMRGAEPGLPPGTHALKVRASPPPLRPEDVLVEVAGLAVEGTVFVRVEPGGEVERLLAVDGRAVLGVGEAEDLVEAAPDGEPALTVVRGGLEIVVAGGPRTQVLSPLELAREGDVAARLWRDGEAHDLRIPRGATLRPTAAPLAHGAGSLLGHTPLRQVAVDGHRVLLLIRAEGYVPARVGLIGDVGRVHVDLDPVHAHPPEFVRTYGHGSQEVVMDREVTVAQYAEFLDATPGQALPAGWARATDGSVEPPPELRSDHPVTQVTWRDARAYAAWRTEVARAAGAAYRFELPDYRTWGALLLPLGNDRRYVWGEHFRSHYAKSCFSRARPRPEPVLRFPLDETLNGLHDTAGGVTELVDGWFWEERGERPVFGGSWIHAEPVRFELKYVWGTTEERAFEFMGFRLALVEDQAVADMRGEPR